MTPPLTPNCADSSSAPADALAGRDPSLSAGALVPPARGIPLWRGGVIHSFAMVDATDFEWLSGYRWHAERDGYAVRTAERGVERMHREILGLKRGDGLQGDHINRDRLDNRRSNLRVVTHAENNRNFPSHRGSSSQYRGVRFRPWRRPWTAVAKFHGERHHLGSFFDESDAARAVNDFWTARGYDPPNDVLHVGASAPSPEAGTR